MADHPVQRQTTLGWIVSGFIVALALGLIFLRQTRVTILHPKFRVLTVKTSRGTNHHIYEGNQLEGKIRHALRDLGFNIGRLPRNETITPTNTYAFLVRYAGDFPDRELRRPRAELVDERGAMIPLTWKMGGYRPGERIYLSAWVLDSQPTTPALIPCV